MRVFLRVASSILTIVSLCSVARAEQPTAAGVRDWHKKVVRVEAVARRIFAANLENCQTKRNDFGFTSGTPDPEATPSVRKAWAEALGLGDGPTVVATFLGGPAAASGLQVGDIIAEANGVRWSPSPEDRQAFASAMAGANSLNLVVKRGSDEVKIGVPAQQICSAEVWLTHRSEINAESNAMNIIIEGGMEQLLTSDDELAYVIAHEAAHVFLGHTRADRAADTKNKKIRSQMERDADALGVRMMLRAGFLPEASFMAQPKMARSSRGPISRLLDLHDPYMATRERTAFLMSEVAAARVEQGAPAVVQ